MDDMKIIEKIKKLFRLADSDNENEAALALSNAEKLMKKHNIEMIDLAEEISIIELSFHEGRLMGWKKYLAQMIAELFFCRTGGSYNFKSNKNTHIFVGSPGNVRTCEEVYNRLIKWCDHKAKIEYPVHKVSVRNEYKNGLAYGMMRRAFDILDERKKSTVENNALVPIKAAVEEHIEGWKKAKAGPPPRVGEETIRGARDAIEAPMFQEVKTGV